MTRLNGWVLFKAIEIMQGSSGPNASLADQIARSRARACSSPRARSRRAGASSTTAPAATASQLWYLPKATHTAALRQYPREYERRVVAFFDEHLGR